MFHLEVLAERLQLTSVFQNITFIAYVQRLANVTKIAKFNLPSIYLKCYIFTCEKRIYFIFSHVKI